MKVALCCIGRLENRYSVEFVEWYKKIGFDKIFIYDNNFGDEEHFEDVLQPYIDYGFVEVVPYRDKQHCQLNAYSEFYANHGSEYDWIGFFDFDEYLTLVDCDNVKEYLSNDVFNGYQAILLNWMCYGDNNLVRYDNRPLSVRFKNPLDYDFKYDYKFPQNNHVKSLVRGGIDGFVWRGVPHNPSHGLLCCDCEGVKCANSPFKQYNFSKCYLRHYFTKTIEEWITHKCVRQYPDRPHSDWDRNKMIDKFFTVNERSDEKEKYLKTLDDNVEIFIGTYKTFEPCVSNNIYKIIVGNHEIENNSNLELLKCGDERDELDDRFYSEIYMLRNLVDSGYQFKEYVGFCHYRKYFEFLDDVPNMDEMFSKYQVVALKPISLKNTVKVQYGKCHNIEDLYIVGGILADKYTDYVRWWNAIINSKFLIPYEMYVMKRDDFLRYIRFISDVLDTYVDVVGGDINNRLLRNNARYLKDNSPNDTFEYQYRIGGYLAERLTNLFIVKNFKSIKFYKAFISEDKYDSEKRRSALKKKVIELKRIVEKEEKQ